MAKRKNKLKNKQKIQQSSPKVKTKITVEKVEEQITKVIKKISGFELTIISMLSLLIIIIVAGIAFFLSVASPKTSTDKYIKLEKDFKKLVLEYYENDLSGKEFTINKQKVSLKTLKDAGYEVKNIKNPYSNKKCREDSYAVIHIKTNEEEVEIVNYLVCDNYITNHK